MRIAIATFQRSENYGAVLQAYALQSFLTAQGHDVDILDFLPQKRVSWSKRWIALNPRNLLLKWQARRVEMIFSRFRDRRLRLSSPPITSSQALTMLADRYEAFMTGSDQVWNPRWIGQIPGGALFYLLTFAGERARKYSFAASFGHAKIETIPDTWQTVFRQSLKQFSWISVREHSGIDLVKRLSGRDDAVALVDPTLLMPASFYQRIMPRTRSRAPYLFSFILHGQAEQVSRAYVRMDDHTGWKVISCCLPCKQLVRPVDWPPTPEIWLARIRDAALVVTNSFHAIVFCLIFHTPFIALKVCGCDSTMNDRVVNLLKSVGLEDRLHPEDSVVPNVLPPIDWSAVDTRLAERRKASLECMSKVEGLLHSG